MLVRFWGTRGSLAKPGPETLRYGGNTSCVEVRSDAGTLVVIDCGTGAHNLGRELVADSKQPVCGHLLISHTHWDHIQGIPFFEPFFDSENEWDIYAPRSLSQSIRDTLAGQMQYTYFPITIEDLGAKISYHDLVEGTLEVGDITVRSRYLNHPALTLGYRLEVDGCSVVYACDHEPPSQAALEESTASGTSNDRHADFLRGADLVIHDAQYTAAEYPEKIGWGHSTAEYAVDVCSASGVKKLALTHHDPLRNDDAVDEIVSTMREKAAALGGSLEVFAAAEGQTIELSSQVQSSATKAVNRFSATAQVAPAISDYSIFVDDTDAETARLIAAAAAAENVRHISATNTEEALSLLEQERPSLVIVDGNSPGSRALAICKKVKELATEEEPQSPIVIIADDDIAHTALDEFATDRIRRPFTPEFIRTRIRAWVLRTACRWQRARRPDNEDARLAALDELGVLDTAPEERFDRIARAAAEALDVPIALVSLIDRNRQWFKSCIGLAARETPRDMAFCAHAILNEDPLIVPDTLLDSRFAENPLVLGELRIRFYAGYPLRLPSGHAMGTLCMIDTRPRQLDDNQMEILRSFAAEVEEELSAYQQSSA